MPEIIEVEFHSKYLSDFQLSRLVQASLRKYTVVITAFISEAVIIEDRCLGVFFDHLQEDEVNRTANGGIICTTKIQRAWKEGRFCSGLMKPDTLLGENTRQIEVSDDQTTPYLFR